MSRLRRRPDAAIIASLFLSSFILHAATAARAVTFSDAGDFLMAIAGVGNCHGPGYPLFIMTSKIFSWIVPFGSLAFRVSLLSGIFASMAGCLIYWAVFRMTRSRIGGAVAAVAFLFSYTFWYQTAIPETYGLNVFFFGLMLVLMLRWERLLKEGRRKSADNTLAVFALVFGLALTNHFSALFVLPAFLFFALDTNWREVFCLRNILRMVVFFIIGLLPYIYVPTAAFRGPYYNYGDPSTPINWYHHVTLFYLRGGLFGYPLRFFPGRFYRYFATLVTEYPYFFWLAAVGLVASFLKKSKKYALFLVLFFIFTAVSVMTYDQLEAVLRAHFYYPSYLVIALWIGFGAAWIARVVRDWAAKRDKVIGMTAIGLAGIVLVAFACVSIPVHYGKVDKSNYFYARDMAVKMLNKAAPDGIILTDADNVVFPCKYMQYVEGVGPNIRVVN
ncbi:MAG: protein O-mannosyl-transferase family, partial [Candidatus Geothermincolia bacterium]